MLKLDHPPSYCRRSRSPDDSASLEAQLWRRQWMVTPTSFATRTALK